MAQSSEQTNTKNVEKNKIDEMLFLVFYLVAFFCLWSGLNSVLRPFYFSSSVDANFKELVSTLLKTVVWLVPVFLVLLFVDKTDPLEYLRIKNFNRSTGIWVLIGLGMLAIYVLAALITKGAKQDAAPFTLLKWLNLTIFPAFIEEILFRGFVFRKLTDFLKADTANIVQALLFAGIHIPTALINSELSAFALPGSRANSLSVFFLIFVFVLGYLLGLLRQYSNSLWPSIVVHIVNNIITYLL